MLALPAVSVDAYYRAAMVGLRLLEAREGRSRRFGEAAAATWRALGGELEEADRLELLLRDASVSNPLAFAPQSVFHLTEMSEDEPFGPRFPQAPRGLAAALLRQAQAEPLAVGDARQVLAKAAAAWQLGDLDSEPALADAVQRIGPATRVVVSGARAIAELATRHEAHADLDLGEQAILVTDSPAERQLFGLVLTGSRGRPRLLSPATASAAEVRAFGFARLDVAVVSSDAAPAAREVIAAIVRELGA